MNARRLVDRVLPVGSRSLIFGVHQCIWHPLTVALAWHQLYGWPSWREWVCIFLHDVGYWAAHDMDGPEGERHPEFGAWLAGKLFGQEYRDLCLYHSRHYTRLAGAEPSRLCWADKRSILFEPWFLYLPRAYLSGELFEYRQLAAKYVPVTASHREWFRWVKACLLKLAQEQRPDALPYQERQPGKPRLGNEGSSGPQSGQ